MCNKKLALLCKICIFLCFYAHKNISLHINLKWLDLNEKLDRLLRNNKAFYKYFDTKNAKNHKR